MKKLLYLLSPLLVALASDTLFAEPPASDLSTEEDAEPSEIVLVPECLAVDIFQNELGQDAFAIHAFRELVAEREGNVTFSPAALENTLELLKTGARGETLKALESVPTGEKGVRRATEVETADALFVADDMALKTAVDPSVRLVPFRDIRDAAQAINAWCREKTHGHIPSAVSSDSLSPGTRMLALSAIHLKAEWIYRFDAAKTDPEGRFHTPDGGTATVPMMHQKGKLCYAEGEDWKAVALPYRNQGLTGYSAYFIGILPKGDARKFAASLTPEKYNAIRSALRQATPAETSLSFPKMKLDAPCVPLDGVLAKLGLGGLFRGADFSGLADGSLHLDGVVQRCRVEVDEEKTVASVVSGIVMVVGLSRHSIDFDRPFIWAIDDLDTGSAPFFMGVYERP